MAVRREKHYASAMNDSEMSTLASVEPFIEALRAHAMAFSQSEQTDEDTLAMRTDGLRMAARVYAEEVYERSGWDNPFYDLFDEFDAVDDDVDDEFDEFADDGDDGDDGDEEEPENTGLFVISGSSEENTESEDDELRLSVVARYDFFVQDEEEFVNGVRERLHAEIPDVEMTDIEESVSDSITAVCELIELDGWDPSQYEELGLTSAGTAVEADAIDLTLFEMADDEDEEFDAFDEFEDEALEDEDEAESRGGGSGGSGHNRFSTDA